MNKVIGFELKKLVSRIGIYILVVLLAGLLVAGVFMYKPVERNTTPLALVGETVNDMYDNFNNDLKQSYIDKINNISSNASTYITASANYNVSNSKTEINNLLGDFDMRCQQYAAATATPSEYESLLNGIKTSLDKLKQGLDNGLNPSTTKEGYYILTTNKNRTKLYAVISNIYINFTSPISHSFAGEHYYNEYRTTLYNCINKLIYPDLNDTASKYVETGSYYTLITSRMSEIEQKIKLQKDIVTENSALNESKDIKNELNVLFNRYVNCVEIFTKSYTSSMCVNALNTVTNKTDRANLVGYNKVDLYQQEENALLYQYYIENHTSPDSFANSLSVTHTSNSKTNAYDFTFFIMSLFSVVIIIFAIYLSAHTISGEINAGNMRFTAVRPVKRGSIFFGKYLAILIMSAILLLFGTITSLIIGGILFGFDSANILTVINGNFIFSAHPMIIVALFVLSLWLIIALYSALTIMLSTFIKSDLLAMIISVVLYVVTLILPLFFGMSSWLKFYPFTNINLFAYFGSTKQTTDSILSKLFNSVVYQGMNIWISLVYIIGITTLLLLIGRHIFKKREL